jgi:nitrite reductase/ring-hydroxylating ferredoxin subunit
MDNSRRTFLTTSLCLLCTGSVAGLLSSCDTVEEGVPVLNIADYPALQRPGGAVKKRYRRLNGAEPILIIRESTNAFVVYSAICTHQEAELRLPKEGVIVCPNHGSKFSVQTGAVISGEAYAPLKQFPAQFDIQSNTLSIG